MGYNSTDVWWRDPYVRWLEEVATLVVAVTWGLHQQQSVAV